MVYVAAQSKLKVNESYWKDKSVMITGITGFAGSWLAEMLLPLGAKIFGMLRRHSTQNLENIEHLPGKITLVEGDLLDQNSVKHSLEKHEVSVLFHLAAQSYVPQSFKAPTETYLTNVIGTANVLEAARMYDGLEKMHFSGSSEEYGFVTPEETPITEDNALRPQSPYAVSKVACDMACYCHHRAYGIPVVITRGFNHTGPRRGYTFVTSVITRQAAEIKLGKRQRFELGNLNAKRDFSDVRDVVRGYMLAVEKAKLGEPYNLCSGKAYSIGEVVDIACAKLGIKKSVWQDPERMRPSDVPLLFGSYAKAEREFGYKPTIKFEDTLSDMLEWQLANVKAGKKVREVR